MAKDRFFGLDVGEHYPSTSDGTSTVSGDDVELSYDKAKVLTKQSLIQTVEEILTYIKQTDFPG